jgi:aryl-alcohol dehydrogenase-like predicted oxidoreductase
MRFIDRVEPDVVQPYRNLIDDDYESSGLANYVAMHDLGVAFFSPLMHGLLLGKYEQPQQFPEGDFRRNIARFGDAAFIARMKHAAKEMRMRFANHPEPVLHAVIGALLAGHPTATVLLGQRNPKQVEAAAKVGEPLSDRDAEWVRRVYRGE